MQNAHEQRIWIENPSALSRYLPDGVVHHLLEPDAPHPQEVDLSAHVARLQELLRVVVTYVPEYAGVSRRALPEARPGRLSRTQGTLLAADLSGFTAFSARLSTLGGEGAELVAQTISALFSTLIDTLAGWDGNLLKLSGDALTALFSGPRHAQCAVAAALELQQRMAAFQSLATPAGVFTLRMRIGLASGPVLMAEVGAAERVELLIAGATARQVVDLQRRAIPGDVVIGGGTYRALAGVCQTLTLSADVYRVRSLIPPERPAPAEPFVWTSRRDRAWEIQALIARIEALRPYLVDQHLARLSDGPPALAGEGDLRPVTVLFACLSDAGPLLESAQAGEDDPALELLQAKASRLWSIVAQHGGTINKLDLHPDGHTLIALFGAPVAQARDTERAVSCALAMLRELAAPRDGDAARPLLVRRIGLTTGRVFAGAVGSTDRREYTVMGSVVNLAARLMDVAGEGQALIDDATAQVVGQRFRLQKQPPALVKGYAEPLPFYSVVAEQRPRLSLLLRDREPIIGREEELALAQACVGRALAGRGSVVALVGEAGIGKSRLLAEIVRGLPIGGIAAPGPVLAVVQNQPYSSSQPYAVVAELLRQLYNLPEQDQQAGLALAALVAEHAPEHKRFLPLLRTMLDLPGEESAITLALNPEERRARMHELTIALLSAHARDWPTALVIEDLHWADAASLTLLADLAVACGVLPLLLICTYRPDDPPPWPDAAHVTRIALRGLTPKQSWALLGTWLDEFALPDDMRLAAVDRTQGNPFFLKETAQALRERGFDADSPPPLPTTVQGALLTRLDRLPTEERYVLQVASTIGSLFRRSLLDQVVAGRVALAGPLARLTELGLLRHDGDDEQYAFAHNLTQETAYESLLFAQRRDLHRRIADTLRGSDPEQADADLGMLAYHYRRAEAWPETLEYAWRAGRRAQALYAGDVALGHYQHALEAANRLGRAAEQRRSAILRRLGDIHALAGRYPDAVAAYQAALEAASDHRDRAEVLICWAEACEQQAAYDEALALLAQAPASLPSDESLALRIAVQRGWMLVRKGASDEARAVVEPCLEQLETLEQWSDLLRAYKVFFLIAVSQGRWGEAHAYLRLALTYAERAGDIREIARTHNNLGVVFTNQGDLRRAAESFERCSRVMEEIRDRYGLSHIKVNIGAIYYKLGDLAIALEQYNTGLEIAVAIGAPHPESIARSNLGEAHRQIGRLPESLEQLQRCVELCREANDKIGLSEGYRQLAETYIALEQLEEAEAACKQALAVAIAATDVQAEAIAHRVHGLLAAACGDYDTALDDVQRSVQQLTELGSTQELGQSMTFQATVYTRLGRLDLAEAILAEAIRLFQKAGAAADLARAEQLLDAIHADNPAEELWR